MARLDHPSKIVLADSQRRLGIGHAKCWSPRKLFYLIAKPEYRLPGMDI